MSLTAVQSSSTVASTANATGSTWLRQGSTGAQVKELQTQLRARGYVLVVDGQFGPQTRSAVLAFQRDQRIAVDGVVGPQTWSALKRPASATPTLRQGSTGAQVRTMQSKLAALGFGIAADGDFGPRTRNAVIAFQRANGLAVDGVVGPQTWGALNDPTSRGPGSVTTTPSVSVNGVRGNPALATAARAVALEMGGYRSTGKCATGVSRAIQRVYGIKVWGNGNTIDDNLPRNKFKQVNIPLSEALKIPGLILTWEKTSTNLGKIYGHTAITLGDGRTSASDYIDTRTLEVEPTRFGLKIFMPIA